MLDAGSLSVIETSDALTAAIGSSGGYGGSR